MDLPSWARVKKVHKEKSFQLKKPIGPKAPQKLCGPRPTHRPS